jgi:DNA-binding response OmpR family regulator
MARIAVFEPHPTNNKLMYKVLSAYGFEVLGFQRVVKTLEEIQALEPNLLVLGYVRGYQPEILGIIDAIRMHSQTRNMPIVVCTTASCPLEEDSRFTTWPGVSILRKPFAAHDLLAAVQQALVSSWQDCGGRA